MKSLWILGVACCVALFAWLLWRGGRESPAPRATDAASAPAAVELVAPAEPAASVAAPERAPVEELEPPPTAEADDERDPEMAEVRGRFVLPGGVSAEGVALELHGWGRNQEDVARYGLPERWEDLHALTGADGRFALRLEPPRAYQFALAGKLEGYAGPAWRWSGIEPGAVVDVGEVELVPCGVVEGRIVDGDGEPVTGSRWLVYVRSVGLAADEGRDESQVIGPADPFTGSFRIEGVMPGRVEVSAHDDEWTKETIVQVRPGETARADVVVRSADRRRTLRVEAHWAPVRMIRADPQHVTLTGPDGAERVTDPSTWPDAFWPVEFEDVGPGEHVLAIDDPRFEPWSRTVSGRDFVEAELVGRSALALRVAKPDGAIIDEFEVEVELRNVNFSPRSFAVPASVVRRDSGEVRGLAPGDYRITVRAGAQLGAADVDGLALGERRAVEIALGAESVVRGRVRFSDGAPAAGVEVAFLGATPANPDQGMPLGDRRIFEDDVELVVSGADGSFERRLARTGEIVLHVATASGIEATAGPLALAPRSTHDVELVLARGGIVAGRVLAPDGASCVGLSVRVGASSSPFAHRTTEARTCVLGPDGAFEIGGVSPGLHSVHLLLPATRQRMGAGSWSESGSQPNVVLGEVEVRDGERTEREFPVDAFPGTIALDVTVNGEPLAGLGVQLRGGDGGNQEAHGQTDVTGRCEVLAFPGTWSVEVMDPDSGWRARDVAQVEVLAAGSSRAGVDVTVKEATLVFRDATTGEPLTERLISLLGREPHLEEFAGQDWFPWNRARTDEQGRLTWTLAPGDYRVRLDEGEGLRFALSDRPDARTAPVTWTADGPAECEVRL